MDFGKAFLYFGYVMSGVLAVVGLIVISGFLLPPYIPQKFRIMFGVVLLLYGIYRFVTLRVKQQQKVEDSSQKDSFGTRR
jgi:hypothetical protein